MPLAYAIDESRGLVISTASGVVTFEEIVSHQDRLLSDPGFSTDFDQLLDCRRVGTIELTSDQAQQVATRRLFSRNSRRALVASQPVVFGVARMLQAYNEASARPSRPAVFYDLAAALKWLDREDLRTVLAG